jgi:hypothetical protein
VALKALSLFIFPTEQIIFCAAVALHIRIRANYLTPTALRKLLQLSPVLFRLTEKTGVFVHSVIFFSAIFEFSHISSETIFACFDIAELQNAVDSNFIAILALFV